MRTHLNQPNHHNSTIHPLAHTTTTPNQPHTNPSTRFNHPSQHHYHIYHHSTFQIHCALQVPTDGHPHGNSKQWIREFHIWHPTGNQHQAPSPLFTHNTIQASNHQLDLIVLIYHQIDDQGPITTPAHYFHRGTNGTSVPTSFTTIPISKPTTSCRISQMRNPEWHTAQKPQPLAHHQPCIIVDNHQPENTELHYYPTEWSGPNTTPAQMLHSSTNGPSASAPFTTIPNSKPHIPCRIPMMANNNRAQPVDTNVSTHGNTQESKAKSITASIFNTTEEQLMHRPLLTPSYPILTISTPTGLKAHYTNVLSQLKHMPAYPTMPAASILIVIHHEHKHSLQQHLHRPLLTPTFP